MTQVSILATLRGAGRCAVSLRLARGHRDNAGSAELANLHEARIAVRSEIRAHIIPRAFYEAVMNDDSQALLLKPDQSKYTEVIQSGIFDRNILCATCDVFLGKLDESGYSIFKNFPTDQENLIVDRDRMPIGYDHSCRLE
jgi:hypothetical protein